MIFVELSLSTSTWQVLYPSIASIITSRSSWGCFTPLALCSKNMISSAPVFLYFVIGCPVWIMLTCLRRLFAKIWLTPSDWSSINHSYLTNNDSSILLFFSLDVYLFMLLFYSIMMVFFFTNFCNFPFYNSSIFPFRSPHSLVVWLWS